MSLPVEEFAVVRAMRASAGLYAAVATAHIVGFVVLVGSAVMLDLRLLGLTKQLPVRALVRHALPWSVAALLLILPSGLLLFAAHAGDLLGNRAFQLKMALLLAAGMNAAIFHTGPYQGVSQWDTHAAAPAAARLSAAASIAIWIAVIACGRLIAQR